MFNKKSYKTFAVFLSLFGIIVFFEIVFRAAALGRGLNVDFLRIALFSLAYSAFFTFILRFFKPRAAKALFLLIVIALNALYFSQTVYYLVMNNFYSLTVLRRVGHGFSFFDRIFMNLEPIQVLYFVPLIAFIGYLIFHKRLKTEWFDIRYDRLFVPFYVLGLAVLLMFVSVQTISSRPITEEQYDYNYSDNDLYDILYSPRLSIDRFGLMTYVNINIRNIVNPPSEEERMDDLVERFLSHQSEYEENEYTEDFEDKNFIFILAESLDTFAIDKHLTPNLYEMLDNSIVFDNFYAPPYYSYTADTEFMMHTSYYPSPDAEQNLTMADALDNHFPNTLPRLFKEQGYHTLAHHNYTDYFYPRGDFHLNTTGYDEYHHAIDLGLLPEDFVPGTTQDTEKTEEIDEFDHPWPSDKEMFEAAMPNVLEHERFFAYFLTVSGHLPYDDTHPISLKNLETVEEIFETEDVRFKENFEALTDNQQQAFLYFHAAHYEFDLALGYLLDKLEAEGQLDDTVIMVASDHFAYGLTQETIRNYDMDKNLEETLLNMHNVPMFMFNPSLERTHIDLTLSSVDVMPTLANMFGLDMDYTTAMGRDVFTPRKNAVLFVNSDFMTDRYFLDFDRKDYLGLRDEDVEKETVYAHYNRLIHRQQMSRYILNTDYFGRMSDDEDD